MLTSCLRKIGAWPVVGLLVLLLSACGGSGSSPDDTAGPDNVTLTRIEITPSTPSLAKGSSLTLSVTGIYSDGSRRDISTEVNWSTSDESIVDLPAPGTVSGVTPGSATVSVSLDGLSASTPIVISGATLNRLEIDPGGIQLAKGTSSQALSLLGYYSDGSTQQLADQATWSVADGSVASVSDPASGEVQVSGLLQGSTLLDASFGGLSAQITITITNATLIQLSISPDSPTLPLGTGLQLGVVATYSDSSQQDVTGQVSWSSADIGVASVSAGGLVSGVGSGSTTVSASLSGISTGTTITVSPAILTSIELSAPSDTLPLGTGQRLQALGHFSDNSIQDITTLVLWQSSPDTRLAVSNAGGSEGLATALATGAATVTAGIGDISASLSLTVTDALLNRIDIEPGSMRLAAGTDSVFNAIGHYSDASTRNLTETVIWNSSDTQVATVSNTSGDRGRIRAVAQGNSAISATLGGISGSATVEVSAALMLSIDVTPAQPGLAAGTSLMMNAVASFSDGSVQDVTDQVLWESASTGVAGIDADGRLIGLQPGSSRISASVGNVSGYTVVTVTDATLSSLAIEPASVSLAAGTEAQLRATATYTDGSQQDVTAQAVWLSDDETVLRAENSDSHRGRIHALASGSATVSASLEGVQDSITVTVTAAQLQALRITSAVTTLESAQQQQLTVIGDFSDGSSQELTGEVTWNSSTPELVQVSNNVTDRGRIKAGIGVSGSATITASYGDISASIDLTVSDTPQRPVSISVVATPNTIRNDGIDATTLELAVQAADPNTMVADGTAVRVDILQGGALLQTANLVTSGGTASLVFNTTDSGVLQVQARVDGTDISGNTVIYAYSTDPGSAYNIAGVISATGFADAPRAGNQVLQGGRFGFFLLNLSNRDFPLLGYRIVNGPDLLDSITDPTVLNGGSLNGGWRIGVIHSLDADIVDQGIVAEFYLGDPAGGGSFVFSVVFSNPPQ